MKIINLINRKRCERRKLSRRRKAGSQLWREEEEERRRKLPEESFSINVAIKASDAKVWREMT
jgi:hypothetical protein